MRDDAKQTDREDRTLARLGTNICFMLMCPLTIYSQLPQFNSTAFVATNNMFTAIQNLKAWLVLYLTIFNSAILAWLYQSHKSAVVATQVLDDNDLIFE